MGEPGNVDLAMRGGLGVASLLTRRSGKYPHGALTVFGQELWPFDACQEMCTSAGV